MNQLGLIHPDLLTRLTPSFYTSSCTIQTPATTRNAVTNQVSGSPADYAGHVGLACAVAPITARENRQPDQRYATATHHVALAGYYPTITPVMLAVVDGVTYDIEGVEVDSKDQTTRLFVRLVD